MSESRDVLSRAADGPDDELSYGQEPDQVAGVWRGTGDVAVVVVHGGFWRAEYDRTHTYPLCGALAAHGWPVAAIEYRRVGQDGGGWPGTFDDVGCVVDTLGDILGVRRLVLLGHSAGGHLALWAASRHRLPPSSRWWCARQQPLAVVSLAGVCDLAAALDQRLGGDAAAGLVGAGADRLAEADPMRLVGGRTPMTLVHGDADSLVPAALSRRYAAAATAAGDPVELRVLPGQGHFELIDPESAAWPELCRAIRAHVG